MLLQPVLIVRRRRDAPQVAFGGAVTDDGTEMDLGSRVSRKKDFIKNGIDRC